MVNNVPFDDRVNHQADMSDLNITLIQSYLKEVNSALYEKSKTGDFTEICQDMNIISSLKMPFDLSEIPLLQKK